MDTIQNFIPITQAKIQLLDMVRRLQDSDNAIAITKNGVPEAVMMSMAKYEGLMETLSILCDTETVANLKRAIAEAQTGEWIDFDEGVGE
jgi:antitoxin YefM